MSGSWLHTSSKSGYSYSTDHSFVILFPDTPRQLIWDIARPIIIGTEKIPTLYKPDQIVNMDTFV